MAPAPKYSHQEEQQRILDAAIECIEETSLLDFTMSSVAKKAGISMGSVYKHVRTKEDVLVALAIEMYQDMHTNFSDTLALPLTVVERLVAGSLICPNKMHRFSFGVHLEKLVTNDAIIERASNDWVRKMIEAGHKMDLIFADLLLGAVEDGELIVSPEEQDEVLEQLSISMWSMHVGFDQVVYHLRMRQRAGIEATDPYPLTKDHPFIRGLIRLINSFEWRQPFEPERFDHVSQVLADHNYI